MNSKTPVRDSADKLLTDYPRPSVAVDTAVLTVHDGRLCAVLVPNGEGWRLPGTFVHEGETLQDAVLRSLRDKAGIEGLRPRQLHVFDALGRDTRGWVMSVAHLVVVPEASVAGSDMRPWEEAGEVLVLDHKEILRLAIDTVRAEYAAAPDPEGLLGAEFTLLELLRLHSAIAGEALGKDTFRRRVIGQLEETGEFQQGVVGKPAKLFRRKNVGGPLDTVTVKREDRTEQEEQS